MARPRILVTGDAEEVVHRLREFGDFIGLHAALAEDLALFFIVVQSDEPLTPRVVELAP